MSDIETNPWESLLIPYRYQKHETNTTIDKSRSPFLVDYDRIIFSSSFRRLSKKTQVHPLSLNDHIHNRLSHSLEVSCVGRSLGNKLGNWLETNKVLPDFILPHNIGEIVQSACLAHDIGNPPFGHAGEDAIRDWFRSPDNNKYIADGLITETERADFCAFDGNAQGFRVITSLEMYKDDGGMHLTYPTLASLVKYPYCAHDALKKDKCKFNFYMNEKELFYTIFSTLGLDRGNEYIRHPLSYLTEAADDICYRIIDMEDARELKIISFNEIMEVIQCIREYLNINEEKLNNINTDRRKSAYIRSLLINFLIEKAFEAFIRNYEKFMSGICKQNEQDLNIINYCDDNVKKYMNNAEKIFKDKIMKDPSKTALEIGSYTVYKRLLDIFIPAAYKKSIKIFLGYREKRALDLMGVNAPKEGDSLYISYLRVIDFISGMTDNYATFISRQLSGV